MATALCPGSFDPPTNGHVDVIRRSVALFDRVVVAVIDNPSKKAMFTPDERSALLKEIHGD
ncbi:MAG: adenylyltransferase/cytidyltransferase family protein, partial [Acidimicrobiia bacterium]